MASQPPYPNSYIRDHLANERTYLAWIRTSLAVMGFGFFIVKFGLGMRQDQIFSMFVGLLLILIGGGMSVLASYHFHAVRRAIDHGHMHPSRRLVTTVTVVVALLAMCIISEILYFGSSPTSLASIFGR